MYIVTDRPKLQETIGFIICRRLLFLSAAGSWLALVAE